MSILGASIVSNKYPLKCIVVKRDITWSNNMVTKKQNEATLMSLIIIGKHVAFTIQVKDRSSCS